MWLDNGGGAFLKALDISPPMLLRESLIKVIGLEAVEIYESAESHVEIGNLLLVHAGVPHWLPLSETFVGRKWALSWTGMGAAYHWAWIRESFFLHEGQFGGDRIVVHGHTPEAYIMDIKERLPGSPSSDRRLAFGVTGNRRRESTHCEG
jgi:hypothetical protein